MSDKNKPIIPLKNSTEKEADNTAETTEAVDPFQFVYDRFGKEAVLALRAQHAPRKLNILQVEDKIAILAPVTAEVVGQYSMMTAMADIGIAKAAEYLISELWLVGDEEIRSDEEYFISAMLQSQRLLELKKSFLMTL